MDHVLNWLGGVGTIVASLLTAYVLFRSRTPAILKDELEITRARCVRLEEDNKKLAEDGHIKDLVIADLKSKTDLTDIRTSLKEVMNSTAATAQVLATVADTLKSISMRLPTGSESRS